jgi:hypothetical protein
MSRRGFMTAVGGGLLGTALVLPQLLTSSEAAAANKPKPLGVPPAVKPYMVDGKKPVWVAGHVHSSFSEGQGSTGAQVSEVNANGFDVLWLTEHDWRAVAFGAPSTIHFNSLTTESVSGKPLKWDPRTVGTLAVGTGSIVSSPTSPNDPDTRGAMQVRAQGSVGAPATFSYYADFGAIRVAQRTNIAGLTMAIDVLPQQVSTDAWLELLVTCSYHPTTAGRPAGRYQISYRFGTAPAGHQVQQLLGIVTVPVTPEQWQTVTVNPEADMAQLWPDLLAADNVLYDFWLGATSVNQQPALGCFDYMQFSRSRISPEQVLQTQDEIAAAYRGLYPTVQIYNGWEYSLYDTHLPGFGARTFVPDYTAYNGQVWTNSAGLEVMPDIISGIRSAGGLGFVGHPFGTGTAAPSGALAQTSALQQVAKRLLDCKVFGADGIETGFVQRGGVKVNKAAVSASLQTHQDLYAILARNGYFLTANGVTDNHTGAAGEWKKQMNRFATCPIAGSASEADLLTAMAAGRVFVPELASFFGALDLWVDGVVPMGSVSVRPDLTRRTMRIMGINLPTGSTVQVVQGVIDYAGTADLTPGTTIVQTLPAAAFTTGTADVVLDTTRSSFAWVNVVSSARRTVAFTNPVYLYAEAPRLPVTPIRRAPDSI